MRSKFNKIIRADSTTVFLFLYGLIAQIIAIPAIYWYNLAYKDLESVFETLIFIWFCIPVVSVFSIVIAVIQIIKRRRNNEKYRTPLIGLALNTAWIFSYLAFIYMVFVVGMPLLFAK
jgi:uncharacterized membrane protein